MRARFLTARIALRLLLAERSGQPPETIAIDAAPGMPPAAPRTGWHFSVSYADAFCLLALSRHGPLGVDLEQRVPVADALLVARHVFHATELRWLDALAPAQRSDDFLRIWVRKEAVCKAAGEGLRMNLCDWSATPRAGDRAPCRELSDGSGRRWKVHDLEPVPGYVGALAYGAALALAPLPVRAWDLPSSPEASVHPARPVPDLKGALA